jgi:hypothetical protein
MDEPRLEVEGGESMAGQGWGWSCCSWGAGCYAFHQHSLAVGYCCNLIQEGEAYRIPSTQLPKLALICVRASLPSLPSLAGCVAAPARQVTTS